MLGAVEQPHPITEALLEYLAKLQTEQQKSFGRIVTAGDLADVRELERVFALPDRRAEN